MNGDRFLRGHGPILLCELQNNNENNIYEIEEIESKNIWKIVAEDRLRNIEQLEKQVLFLQNLLTNFSMTAPR